MEEEETEEEDQEDETKQQTHKTMMKDKNKKMKWDEQAGIINKRKSKSINTFWWRSSGTTSPHPSLFLLVLVCVL